MPVRHTRLTPEQDRGDLAAALAALREEYEVPHSFPPGVLAEVDAISAIDAGPLATGRTPERDLTHIPFVTLDPAGSRDLDQAFHLTREGEGFLVRYAIADLPGFVQPGGALDEEARLRGVTLYLPDGRAPLHPFAQSEGLASLLPGEKRSAFVWEIRLDGEGTRTGTTVFRAVIRSREALDYDAAQAAIESGSADEQLLLLAEIGALRIERERIRGGASLTVPEERVVRDGEAYRIELRRPLPIEEWNAQLSLLTGIAAAETMLEAGVGVLRTMPKPDESALTEFRTRVSALGCPWPSGLSYGEYLRQLDHGAPTYPAIAQAATTLFRGAGYTVFDGALPELKTQAAIAAPYAHVTAPLRRLVDRWGLVVCEAVLAGREVPEWTRASLAELPQLMQSATSRASQISSAAVNRVEAAVVRTRIGETFSAVVTEARGETARVQVTEPPISARIDATGVAAGDVIDVRVVSADVARGTIELANASR